jgi:hypothetical protein
MFASLSAEAHPTGGAWDKLHKEYRQLSRLTTQYQLLIERAITTSDHPWRVSIVKWNRDPRVGPSSRREVLLEVYSPEEAVPALIMLLSLEKEKANGL